MREVIFSIIPLFFTVLLFQSCFIPHTNTPERKYLITIQGFNLPPVIKKGYQYKIPIRIHLYDSSLNWTICLASLRPPIFNISGNPCVTKPYESSLYEIYLPSGKQGYITLVHPEYLLDKRVNIIVNACYRYYNVFSLLGCTNRNKVCTFNITNVFPETTYIKITKAEAIYDYKKKSYYLRLYINPKEESNIYLESFNKSIDKCYIEGPTSRYKIHYELRYGKNSISGDLYLIPGSINQVDIDLNKLGINTDIPLVYLEFRLDYTVLQKIYLGSSRIEG